MITTATIHTIAFLALLPTTTVFGQEGAAVANLPDDFDWENEFDTLPGSRSIYAGIKSSKPLPFFPQVVDVSLQSNSKNIPDSLPVEFIFAKVMERFDIIEPGYDEIDPANEIYAETGPARQRELRGGVLSDEDQAQHHRNLMKVCPKCKRKKHWKRCVKNKCKYHPSSRHRKLDDKDEDHDDDDNEEEELSVAVTEAVMETGDTTSSTSSSATTKLRGLRKKRRYSNIASTVTSSTTTTSEQQKQWGTWSGVREKFRTRYSEAREKRKEALAYSVNLRGSAKKTKNLAEEYESYGNPGYAALLNEQSLLMDQSAELLEEKAQDVEKIAILGEQNVNLQDQIVNYKQKWMKAVDMLEIELDEIKSLGKMEDSLNKVVGWFANNWDIDLGIVVDKLPE